MRERESVCVCVCVKLSDSLHSSRSIAALDAERARSRNKRNLLLIDLGVAYLLLQYGCRFEIGFVIAE